MHAHELTQQLVSRLTDVLPSRFLRNIAKRRVNAGLEVNSFSRLNITKQSLDYAFSAIFLWIYLPMSTRNSRFVVCNATLPSDIQSSS